MTPFEEYTQRFRARESQVARFEKIHIRVANIRLLIAAAAAIAGWLSLTTNVLSSWWLGVFGALFIGIAIYHSRVGRIRNRAQRAAAFYRDGLARIEDRWAGNGPTAERFDDPHHVYAADLDLFGKAGLFELLSNARTRMGEDTLARWLLAPASLVDIRKRHACLTELRPLLDLREELSMLGQPSKVGVYPQALAQWALTSNALTQGWLKWAARSLPALALAAAIIWGAYGAASPLLVIVLVEIGLVRLIRKPLNAVLYGTEHAFEDLKLFAEVLVRLEREPFSTPQLRALIQELSSRQQTASRNLASLATIVQFMESRRNPILQILDMPLMYSVQVALAAERWRAAHGGSVQSWLDITGELEALIAIAAYSYERPQDTLPQFIDGPASFTGISLGHPLIAAARCVRNDVSIRGQTRVLLISGSNMSGKSTLMRTVGINIVLAMAGAPVRAQHCELTPLQVGASIRINDSLHEGSSRFYAEITRLRQLYDASGHSPPLLFLLDEVLQGTNSGDRRAGVEGMLSAFLDRGAIGLISTHDLALTDIAVAQTDALRNMHFQDELKNGKMVFDFTLRDGIVTKSNGIELMRSIGLKV